MYQNRPITVERNENAYVFNSTGEDSVFIEVDTDREYKLHTIFGECYERGTLYKGITRVALPNCGMIFTK